MRTKPRKEEEAVRQLGNQGYEAWSPRYATRRLRGDRWRIVSGPLFPGYAFVRPSRAEQGLGPIRSTIGVAYVVRFGEAPAVLAQAAIDDLHAIETQLAALVANPVAAFEPGAVVRVVSGPLAGLEGVVSHVAKERVAVLLHLLGREKNVLVPADALMAGE
mgnify:CR=1 FL=1